MVDVGAIGFPRYAHANALVTVKATPELDLVTGYSELPHLLSSHCLSVTDGLITDKGLKGLI